MVSYNQKIKKRSNCTNFFKNNNNNDVQKKSLTKNNYEAQF